MLCLKHKIDRAGIRKAALFGAVLVLAAGSQAEAEDLKIGVALAISGPNSFLGVPESNSIKMAVEGLNAQKYFGPNYTFIAPVVDVGDDRAQLLSLLNRAVNIDNALAFIGVNNSGTSIAVAPVVNQLQIPYFGSHQTGAPLKAGPWNFKTTLDSVGAIAPLGKYAADKLKPKRPAIIYVRDNEGHVGNKDIFRDTLVARGYKFVAEESVLSTDTDFSAAATKIAGTDPDLIWLGANAVQAANIAIQLKQAGLPATIPMFGSSSLGADYINAGGKAVENTYYETDYDEDNTLPGNQEFIANYTKRYGIRPDTWAAVGYTQLMLVARAIKESLPNPTREKVRVAITNMKDFPTVMGNGTLNFGPDRLPIYDPPIFVLKNGKYVRAP